MTQLVYKFYVNVGMRYFKGLKILSKILNVSYCAIKKKEMMIVRRACYFAS